MSVPQKIRCRVEQVVSHGGRVYTLELIPERPVPRYLPGQFLHLAIDPYQPGDFWPESRVFSIVSPPDQRKRIVITYSVAGQFTARMEKEIIVGKEVWIKLPYGDFIIDGDREVALIAGGTGITAFTAFLNGLTVSRPQRISLFYGARTRDLLIFKPLIEQKKKEVKALSAWYFIEEGELNGEEGIIPGRFSGLSVMTHISNSVHTDFYLSGPPGMLKNLNADLKLQGILSEQIKVDSWE
jgi:ferredoxin-NADP reductase